MSATKKSSTAGKSVPHLARFHKSPVLTGLVKAYDELRPLVEEAEVAFRSCLQTRSELFDGRSKRPEREQEDRCINYYGWVIRLEAVIDPLRDSINSTRKALDRAGTFLGQEKNWKSVQGYHLCKLIELNIVTVSQLMKRALEASSKTEYDIHDANLSVSIAMMLGRRREEALEWLDGVPELPVTDENETEWQVVKSDRITNRMIAHLLTFVDGMSDGSGGCISIGDDHGEASRAARIMRDKGWDVQVQNRTSPDITPGLQIRKPCRKKTAGK